MLALGVCQAAFGQAAAPITVTEEVTVTAPRTFRNLADVPNPTESLIGLADAASEGAITSRQLDARPLLRPGDILETVPGLVISQHSGEGKANQYYLRGFNLDHGTDFAVNVAGIPVNMPTHGHGQGWSDVNFLIPELVGGIQFRKGPYYADEGDFSSAGAASISYVNALERPLVRAAAGGDGFARTVAAASPRVGNGNLLVGVEAGHNNGPWDTPERYRRLNGVVRYSEGDTRNGFSITGLGYNAHWTATDQIAQRALDERLLSRFGTLDASDGGDTHRYAASADAHRSRLNSMTNVSGFVMNNGLDLFSNFTYYLADPVRGDQFEQVDQRWTFGGRATHRIRRRWLHRVFEDGFGVDVRHDAIGPLGLYGTERRSRHSVTREDRVRQSSVGLHYQEEIELSDRLRARAGVRGDVFHFDVRSNAEENGGVETAGVISPKLGVVYTPSRQLELYGDFGYGYHSNDARGATIATDPATGAHADRVTPLVRTRGEEVGLRTTVLPKLQTTVAVWRLGLDSELVFVGDAGTTEAGRPSIRHGIEWANYFNPTPWLTIDGDLSWSSARFRDDDPAGSAIPGAVGVISSMGVAVNEIRRLSGALRFRYLGPRPLVEDGTIQSSRSTLVNAEGGYRLSSQLRLAVNVLNLSNARTSDIEYYYPSRLPGDPAGGISDIHLHPLQPRTARISLRVDF